MKYPAKGGSDDFKRVASGTHIAVCNLVADIGLQPGSALYPKPKRKLYIRFEVPAERVKYEKDGKEIEGPMTIGSFYTASMNEKAQLRKALESWRGRAFTDEQAEDFDVASILGKPCVLSVVESTKNGKTYSNIASIGSLPRGMDAPKAENPLLLFDPSSDKSCALSELQPWLQEKIAKQIQPESEKDEIPTQEERDGFGEKLRDDFKDSSIPF